MHSNRLLASGNLRRYKAAACEEVSTSEGFAEIPVFSKCAATSSGVREELFVRNKNG